MNRLDRTSRRGLPFRQRRSQTHFLPPRTDAYHRRFRSGVPCRSNRSAWLREASVVSRHTGAEELAGAGCDWSVVGVGAVRCALIIFAKVVVKIRLPVRCCAVHREGRVGTAWLLALKVQNGGTVGRYCVSGRCRDMARRHDAAAAGNHRPTPLVR